MIPFPPYMPDGSPFDETAGRLAKNVLPRPGLPPDPGNSPQYGGYAPMPNIQALSSAIATQPFGGFLARDDAGTTHIFVGTTTKLYKYDKSTASFTDVSGATYSLGSGEIWSFTQFGLDVIATNKSNGMLVYTLGTSTTFAALGGSPEKGRVVGVIGDFLFLGEPSSTARSVYWSELNDDVNWRVGRNLSDFQIFPDGNEVTGIVGWNDGGLIFQRRAIRQVVPNLSSGVIFEFRRNGEDHGCISPGSLVKVGRRVFYLAETGFYEYGSPPIPIGENVINRTFLADINQDDMLKVQGAADPRGNRIFWRYRSSSGTSSVYSDKVLCYDYSLNRWSEIDVNLSWIMGATTGGYTLETIDALGDLDSLGISLDDQSLTASIPFIAGMTSDYKLGVFSGDNLEARIDTGTVQLSPGRRTLVNGFRILGDADGSYGTVISKSRPGASEVIDTEYQATSATGSCDARSDAQFHRFQVRIPSATSWTFVHGVDVDAVPSGAQ